jgi:hypothetical protein
MRPGASARRATCHAARHRLFRLCCAFGCLGTSRGSSRRSLSTSTTPRVRVPWHVARLIVPLVVDYFAYVARPGASARRAAYHAAHRRLLRLRCASGCLSTSRGLLSASSPNRASRCLDTSHRLLLTTFPTSRVRVPRHVARLISPLVVDFFAYAARPVPRHVARLVVNYYASRRLIVDFFAYAARPGASARCAARHRLHHLAHARCRLLHLRRASGCLRTSHGSSRRSSSTTSPTPPVWVPRHVTRLVTRLVVDYSVRRDFILRPHWLYFSHAVRRDYLSRGNTGSTSSTPRAAVTSSYGCIASTIHLD